MHGFGVNLKLSIIRVKKICGIGYGSSKIQSETFFGTDPQSRLCGVDVVKDTRFEINLGQRLQRHFTLCFSVPKIKLNSF